MGNGQFQSMSNILGQFIGGFGLECVRQVKTDGFSQAVICRPHQGDT
jgi:hypothetical protein